MATDRRRTVSEELRNQILELAFAGLSAAETRRRMASQSEGTNEVALVSSNQPMPDVRTVQRIIGSIRLREDSEEKWSLVNNKVGLDSRLVLETLGEITVGTEGRVDSLNLTEAKWLNRIRESTEGLSGWGTWILYKLSVEANDYQSSGLDVVLGLKPWMDERRASELQKLIDSGSIPAPSCWSFIKTRSKLMKNGIFGGNGGEL